MSPSAFKLLCYAYDRFQETGSAYIEYQAPKGNDLTFAANAVEELSEEGCISEVVEFALGFSFRLETIGIEYVRSHREP